MTIDEFIEAVKHDIDWSVRTATQLELMGQLLEEHPDANIFKLMFPNDEEN